MREKPMLPCALQTFHLHIVIFTSTETWRKTSVACCAVIYRFRKYEEKVVQVRGMFFHWNWICLCSLCGGRTVVILM